MLVSILLSVLIEAIVVHGQTDTSLLTIKEAFQLMNDRNPALQRVQNELKQKEYEKGIKRGLYMPKVSIRATAVTMSDPIHLDMSEVGDAISTIYETLGNYGVFSDVPYVNEATGEVITILDEASSTTAVREQLLEGAEEIANAEWDQIIQEESFASVSANFSWPVFTGGKIAAANKAANVEFEISEQEYRKTQGELLAELTTRYYGLVLTMQVADVMKEKYDAMYKHYSDAQKMFDEGMIAKVELLSAKVALSDASREYKKLLRSIETIRAGLSATLATAPDTCFIPASHLFINNNLPGVEYWINQTYDSNPQLKQISCKKDLLDIKSKVNKGNYLPTVAIMGTYNLADYDLSPYTPDWLVGAGLNWTVFDGMARYKQVKADKTLSAQVEFAENKALDDLRAYVTKLYNELINQLAEIKELKNTLELATEYCSSTEKAFSEGFSNSTTVEEARVKVAQVKALRLKAFYEYDVALSQLLQIAGISEQFLEYSSGSNAIFESLEK